MWSAISAAESVGAMRIDVRCASRAELSRRTIELSHGTLDIRPQWTGCASRFFPYSAISRACPSSIYSRAPACSPWKRRAGAYPVVCVEKDGEKFPALLRNAAIAGGRIECKSMPRTLFLETGGLSISFFATHPFRICIAMRFSRVRRRTQPCARRSGANTLSFGVSSIRRSGGSGYRGRKELW